MVIEVVSVDLVPETLTAVLLASAIQSVFHPAPLAIVAALGAVGALVSLLKVSVATRTVSLAVFPAASSVARAFARILLVASGIDTHGAAILEGIDCDMARPHAKDPDYVSPYNSFFRFSFGPLLPETFESDVALFRSVFEEYRDSVRT